MSSNRTRTVTPVQAVALLLSFLSLSVMTGVLGAGLLVPAVGSAGAAVKAIPAAFDSLPDDFQAAQPASESTMVDTSGNVIAHFYDKRRVVVKADEIADVMKKAIVAIEDRRFYSHRGVDPQGVLSAAVSNFTGSKARGGASTLTQQFVRNTLLERGMLEGDIDQINAATAPTAQRKLQEMKYALTVEQKMSKDEILTGYLNIAPFGPVTYGVETAANLYFSKSAKDLTIVESALLAGLVQSPSAYDPLTEPDAAQARRNVVLDQMLRTGAITQEEHDEATAINVSDMLTVSQPTEGCAGADSSVAYFCSFALEQFLNDETYGETRLDRRRLLKNGGVTITTTLDAAKQQAARDSSLEALPLDNANVGGGLDNSIVALDPPTGNIVAMAQNTNYEVDTEGSRNTMNNFATGKFQPGSTFKVFTLLEWFKEGHNAYESVGRASRFYPSGSFKCDGSPIGTEPATVTDLPGGDGPMTVLLAFQKSVNQAIWDMASKVDFCKIFETAHEFGVNDPLTADGVPLLAPSNLIGTVGTEPLVMASLAATLANDGLQCTPTALLKTTSSSGEVLKEYKPSCETRVDPEIAQKTTTVLNKVASDWYSPKENVRLDGGRPFAAKSGTTNDAANTWFIGYTPQLAAASWVGHSKASSMPVHGVTIGGKSLGSIFGSVVGQYTWAPFMNRALADVDPTPFPQADIGSPPGRAPRPDPNADEGAEGDSNGAREAEDMERIEYAED